MNVRRTLVGVVAALSLLGVPAAALADHTQQLNVGTELVRQQAGGKPWIVNLSLGATLGSTDGVVPSPVNHMVFRFTRGARVHPEAFGTCTLQILEQKGAPGCPKSSRLGSGKATANALQQNFPATIDVFNGPQVGNGHKLLIYARALSTVVIPLEGTLTKTPGKYGYKLDLPVGRIRTVGDNDAAILDFEVTVGGIGRKGVPFIEAPTSCAKPGWPFLGTFTYADGSSGTSAASINCLLKATNR
ncbi:hypothetical protein DSM104299_04277 [Baekduia alba]|uniref:hypothetical protein n=1 Tax=Baekduia alba TaxID=2997333 RepID=UPI0023428207|nr:hypothetical protein [Baekduia alba]WCB95528.1 hypothetical protein DSM104299_04277 [Baekduia alba]